ncbi:MAG: SdpI family protein [Proteobacteria bacterium]|nr:SdpI family protein [Pseudomonadota bacterium]
MNTRIANIISIAGIVALGAYFAVIYPDLPDPMPTHWNAAGEADGWMSRPGGTASLIAVPVFMFVLFKLIPVMSPRGFRTESFTGVLNILMTTAVVFGCVIAVGAVRAALGSDFEMSTFIMGAVGLLFMVMGNFLGKVRKNFFIGIRTPWTLASDEVWAKTHRLGGWCFVIAGALIAIAAVTAPGIRGMGYIVIGMVLVPVVYSYLAYRRIEGFAPDPEIEEE